MAATPCKHVENIQYMTYLSNSRLRSGSSVAALESLAELGKDIRAKCIRECEDSSPYRDGADAS